MACMERKRTLPDCHNPGEKKVKTDSTEEQEFINYASVPSLQSIATVNVVTALCRLPDIVNAIVQHSLRFDPDGIRIRCENYAMSHTQLDKSISSKVSLLPLPTSIKTEVTNNTRPIKLQILNWIRYRKDKEYLDSIRWTIHGTIDKEKTLLQFIDKGIGQNVDDIYKLVCKCCSENCISKVSKQLQSKAPRDYLVFNNSMYDAYEDFLMAYWISVVRGELSELLSSFNVNDIYDSMGIYDSSGSIYRNIFLLSVSQGNVMAVKYFWEKLTDEEININIMQWINSVQTRITARKGYQKTNEYCDVFFFLLSQLRNSEQQRYVLQKYSYNILKSLFLYWPWQRFLLPTLKAMWGYLEEEVYINLLSLVAREIKEGYGVETFLRKIWSVSPLRFRRCFIQNMLTNFWDGTDVFCQLLLIEDVDTINILLEDADMEEKKVIIFSVAKNDKLYEVLCRGNLTLLDALIENNLTLESELYEFKEKIILEHGRKLCHMWICDDNFNIVEKFFSWASRSPDQFENFKNRSVNKIEIVYSIVYRQTDFELANKFLNWCCNSEEVINRFKKDFASSKPQVIMLGKIDWNLLENFVEWCFLSNEDVNAFKLNILESDQLSDVIFDSVIYSYDFEFVDKLINWCCHSNEEITKYKGKFALSDRYLAILQRFVSNYKVYDSEHDNWELTRRFIKLFSPLEDTVIIALKRNIKSEIDFDNHKTYYFPTIEKNDVYNLINNACDYEGEEISNTDDSSDND